MTSCRQMQFQEKFETLKLNIINVWNSSYCTPLINIKSRYNETRLNCPFYYVPLLQSKQNTRITIDPRLAETLQNALNRIFMLMSIN